MRMLLAISYETLIARNRQNIFARLGKTRRNKRAHTVPPETFALASFACDVASAFAVVLDLFARA
jgi:hypothetical protein